MKISFNWLKNYFETELNPNEVAAILTNTGLEVESVELVESIKGGLVGVVIGEVLSKVKHPDADRLNITTVNIGSVNILQIVCGASNVEIGQKVLVATVGSTIYPKPDEPLKIKNSKIRGIESEGMICAEDELGLGNSHEGILVLPAESKIGTTAADFFKLEKDFLFEIGLTPNRSDAMGHIGVARDLKAYLNFHTNKKQALKIPVFAKSNNTETNEVKLTVSDVEACPRYSFAVIKNIQVTESPDWLKNKLRTIGIKPINNVVDITNYVMFETGNPLHAFDLKEVGSEIHVRKSNPEEKIITLDGVERTLKNDSLLICNAGKAMCIAGIFGGQYSGINNTTTSLLLEAAYFNPTSIRRTAKSLGLNTDSSFRFERGVDANNIDFSRKRAIELILEIAGGELVQEQDNYPQKIEPAIIEFSFDRCRKLCGAPIKDEEIKKILSELEIQIKNENINSVTLIIPTYRVDVKREADVIEEILRIYGFNSVPIPSKLNSSLSFKQKPDASKIFNLVADLLVSNGFFEIMNNSLTSSTLSKKINSKTYNPENAVVLLNPLSNELDALRQTLLLGGLSSIEFNQNRQAPNLKLFELGKVYHKSTSGYEEYTKLALFITGERRDENWTNATEKSSFYSLKSTIEKILTRIGLSQNLKQESLTNDLIEDGYSLLHSKQKIAEIGWINSTIQKEMGLKNSVFYAEFDWDVILKLCVTTKTEFKPIPKTQFVRRDFSLLLDESIKFEQIKSIAFKLEKNLLHNVGLFDVYEGKNLAKGKKSYAVSFIFQDSEKTLQDSKIDTIMQTIKADLENELGAELR